jgi:tRNA A-37 threonylcarbamoyl transferase component Bud32
MNLIATLVEELASVGLTMRKGQARSPVHLTMELEGSDGVSAGQWRAQAADTLRAAAHLADEFGARSVQVLAGGHLLVQHGGADCRLPLLHGLVAEPGAELVAHRPNRRAVVRVDPARYVKVVRPGRTGDVVRPLAQGHPDGVRVPRVLAADDETGLVVLSAVPGRTLHDRLAEHDRADEDLALQVKQVGAAARAWHDQGARAPLVVHDGAAETAGAYRWLEAAGQYGLLDPARWRGRLAIAASRLSGGPAELVVLHRDLHDKQLLLEDSGPVGLLDLDLAACGDPAVDLANLLVHLELRALQGHCSDARARACAVALLEGYSPGPALLGRLGPYAAATRLRLAGLYCFRPARPGLVDDLVRRFDEDPVERW